jgi:hypothetical protein
MMSYSGEDWVRRVQTNNKDKNIKLNDKWDEKEVYNKMGGEAGDWILKPKENRYIEADTTQSQTYSYWRGGNYMMVYRNGTYLRTVPFNRHVDPIMGDTWAVVEAHRFYGSRMTANPFKRFTVPLLYIGLNLNSDFSDPMLRDGVLIKADEISGLQIPMHVTLTEQQQKDMIKGNKMQAQTLALKTILHEKTKKSKFNWWWFVIIMAIVMGVFLVAMAIFNPSFYAPITNLFKGVGSIIPPAAPPGAVTTTR